MDLKPLFVFPRWSNTVTLIVVLVLAIFPLYAAVLVAYGLDPVALNVGYQPVQPIPYSHKLHVGELGLDCRYCHNTVEKADFAAIPPTETCMNCHRAIRPKSEKLQPLRDSFGNGDPDKKGLPVPWKQVTTVPDFVYFSHPAHVNSGISCVECHGQINQMETVYQAKPMNMAWCLQCHRDPDPRIRPRDEVTHLDWKPSENNPSTVAAFATLSETELKLRGGKVGLDLAGTPQQMAKDYVKKLVDTKSLDSVKRELGEILRAEYHINPNTDCVTCHR